MAPTYIAAVVAVISNLLDLVGIHVMPADLQTTVVTMLTILAGAVVMYRQISQGRSTAYGIKPM